MSTKVIRVHAKVSNSDIRARENTSELHLLGRLPDTKHRRVYNMSLEQVTVSQIVGYG